MASIIDPGIPTSVEVCDEELSCGGPQGDHSHPRNEHSIYTSMDILD